MALVQRYKLRKRPCRESSDDFSIEEISADDMGYDGDVEVLHPDQYEEPESDFEDHQALNKLWPDTDDELASKLRRLSCERGPKVAQREVIDRGRKRLSKEMDEEEKPTAGRTEFEVSEIVDGQAAQPPAKRRRQRSGKTPLGHRPAKKQAHQTWTDSSDKTEEATIESSNDHSTPEATNTPSIPLGNTNNQGDVDAMELG